MAHAIFVAEAKRRQLSYDVYSAGVFDFRGAPPIRETTNTCELNNTPAPEEIATWVSDLPLASISRFLVMEQLHADVLMYEYGVSLNLRTYCKENTKAEFRFLPRYPDS